MRLTGKEQDARSGASILHELYAKQKVLWTAELTIFVPPWSTVLLKGVPVVCFLIKFVDAHYYVVTVFTRLQARATNSFPKILTLPLFEAGVNSRQAFIN